MWLKHIPKIKNIRICKKQNKRVYRTHTGVEKAIEHIWKQQKVIKYYYKCGGHYHITSQQTFNGVQLKTSKLLEKE